jgi:hypothetical protein
MKAQRHLGLGKNQSTVWQSLCKLAKFFYFSCPMNPIWLSACCHLGSHWLQIMYILRVGMAPFAASTLMKVSCTGCVEDLLTTSSYRVAGSKAAAVRLSPKPQPVGCHLTKAKSCSTSAPPGLHPAAFCGTFFLNSKLYTAAICV